MCIYVPFCVPVLTLSQYVHSVVFLQVWQEVLWQLQKLLSPEEAGHALDSNLQYFHSVQAIIKILLTSKVLTTILYNPQTWSGANVYMYAVYPFAHNVEVPWQTKTQ